jgi:hypothetical protein
MQNHVQATTEEIVSLERSYWDAMKTKDGKRTAELSAQTSLVTGTKGVMVIQKAQMGKMTETGNWSLESYAFDDIQVSNPVPDVAIIAYTVRQKGTMDNKPYEIRAADSSTWIHGSNGWECHAHSESVLAD